MSPPTEKGNRMKYVRTARGYQTLTVPKGKDGSVTVDRAGVELSESDAKKAEELADTAGVAIEVSDKEFEAEAERVTVGQQTPDLSAGRGAVTGTGAPVQTYDVEQPEGGEADMSPDAAPATTASTAPARAAAATTTPGA